MKAISFLFVPLLVLISVDQVHASCKSSKRVHASDSSCLWGNHKNKKLPWYHFGAVDVTAQAQNRCADQGKIVVKVDRKHKEDWTWTLNSSDKREKTGDGFIRGVYCCTDLSDDGLCQNDED